jgi:hypothetical protein
VQCRDLSGTILQDIATIDKRVSERVDTTLDAVNSGHATTHSMLSTVSAELAIHSASNTTFQERVSRKVDLQSMRLIDEVRNVATTTDSRLSQIATQNVSMTTELIQRSENHSKELMQLKAMV